MKVYLKTIRKRCAEESIRGVDTNVDGLRYMSVTREMNFLYKTSGANVTDGRRSSRKEESMSHTPKSRKERPRGRWRLWLLSLRCGWSAHDGVRTPAWNPGSLEGVISEASSHTQTCSLTRQGCRRYRHTCVSIPLANHMPRSPAVL